MSENTPENKAPPPDTGSSATLNLSQAASICAVGMGICFFIPWAHFLGQKLSGYDLQQMGDIHRALWLIPVFAVFTVIAGFGRQGQKGAALATGVMPFFVLAYWLHKLGSDLMKILEIGAYGELSLGFILIILASRLK